MPDIFAFLGNLYRSWVHQDLTISEWLDRMGPVCQDVQRELTARYYADREGR